MHLEALSILKKYIEKIAFLLRKTIANIPHIYEQILVTYDTLNLINLMCFLALKIDKNL